MVTGLPSEGREYVVLSVTLLSSSVSLPVLLSVSVGAGRGGALRESAPILARSKVRHDGVGMHGRCYGSCPTLRCLGMFLDRRISGSRLSPWRWTRLRNQIQTRRWVIEAPRALPMEGWEEDVDVEDGWMDVKN